MNAVRAARDMIVIRETNPSCFLILLRALRAEGESTFSISNGIASACSLESLLTKVESKAMACLGLSASK